jgi:hypothetical protein
VCFKGHRFNKTVICAHATDEEKDDTHEGSFYDKLDMVYCRAPEHDTKITVSPKYKDWYREVFWPST